MQMIAIRITAIISNSGVARKVSRDKFPHQAKISCGNCPTGHCQPFGYWRRRSL